MSVTIVTIHSRECSPHFFKNIFFNKETKKVLEADLHKIHDSNWRNCNMQNSENFFCNTITEAFLSLWYTMKFLFFMREFFHRNSNMKCSNFFFIQKEKQQRSLREYSCYQCNINVFKVQSFLNILLSNIVQNSEHECTFLLLHFYILSCFYGWWVFFFWHAVQ